MGARLAAMRARSQCGSGHRPCVKDPSQRLRREQAKGGKLPGVVLLPCADFRPLSPVQGARHHFAHAETGRDWFIWKCRRSHNRG
jgi:hypothetical protein